MAWRAFIPFLVASAAFAQSASGTVCGTVADPEGARFPGTTVPSGATVSSPGRSKGLPIVVLTEDVFSYRHTFLEGRAHPKNGEPTGMRQDRLVGK
jgi:hypothetical protein